MNHSTINGHLDYLQFGAITQTILLWIFLYTFWSIRVYISMLDFRQKAEKQCVYISVENIPKIEVLVHGVCASRSDCGL